MPSGHLPVLLDPVVELLAPVPPGVLVDATVGLGGHAAALLAARPDLGLLGLDRDRQALARAAAALARHAGRVELVESPFDRLPELLEARDRLRPVAVLADLGCS
jgi:16S rRNA (cytosine1402-N4)-methyltransferase